MMQIKLTSSCYIVNSMKTIEEIFFPFPKTIIQFNKEALTSKVLTFT